MTTYQKFIILIFDMNESAMTQFFISKVEGKTKGVWNYSKHNNRILLSVFCQYVREFYCYNVLKDSLCFLSFFDALWNLFRLINWFAFYSLIYKNLLGFWVTMTSLLVFRDGFSCHESVGSQTFLSDVPQHPFRWAQVHLHQHRPKTFLWMIINWMYLILLIRLKWILLQYFFIQLNCWCFCHYLSEWLKLDLSTNHPVLLADNCLSITLR